jgi:hypothetical protein
MVWKSEKRVPVSGEAEGKPAAQRKKPPAKATSRKSATTRVKAEKLAAVKDEVVKASPKLTAQRVKKKIETEVKVKQEKLMSAKEKIRKVRQTSVKKIKSNVDSLTVKKVEKESERRSRRSAVRKS